MKSNTPFEMTDAEKRDYQTLLDNRYTQSEAWRQIMQARNPPKAALKIPTQSQRL